MVSAVSGQRLAQLTKSVLERIRNDDSFSAFYSKAKITPFLIHFFHESVEHLQGSRSEVDSHLFPKHRRTTIALRLLICIVNAIEHRFSQPSFAAYEKMESLLLKGINGESYTAELDYMKVSYNDNINFGSLKANFKSCVRF